MYAMMIQFLAIIAVGLVFLLRGRDKRAANPGPARWLLIAGLVPLGLQAAVFLLFAVGEMVGGDFSGAGHLLSLAVLAILAALAWLRPVEGGAAFLISGIAGLRVNALILGLPLILSGLLFIIGGVIARQARPPSSTESPQADQG